MRSLYQFIALLWRVPFTFLSMLFFIVMRWLVRKRNERKQKAGQRAQNGNKEGTVLNWLGLGEVFSSYGKNMKVTLARMMYEGSKWNCHATLAQLGPFVIKSNIEIDTGAMDNSVQRWSICIVNVKKRGSNMKRYEAVITSDDTNNSINENNKFYRISLKHGMYLIVLRYWEIREMAVFPEIKVDGIKGVSERSTEAEITVYNRLLSRLKNYHSAEYYFSNYCSYNLVRWKAYLPKKFVKERFLPGGHEDINYEYDLLNSGEILLVNFDEKLFNDALIYITQYNLSSFPIFWDRITKVPYSCPRIPCQGFYIIRIVKKKVDFVLPPNTIECESTKAL